MRKFFISLFSLFLLFTPFCAFAKEKLQVEASKCGGYFQSNQKVELLVNDKEAEIFWTIYPSGSPALGKMYKESIIINRSSYVYFYAYTDFFNATKFEKCRFFIETSGETNYLRVLSVDTVNDEIVLKNWSKFDTDLSGWRLESLSDKVQLSQTLRPNQELKINIDLNQRSDHIRLFAPSGRAKDNIFIPFLRQDEIFIKIDQKNAFSIFEKELK